MIPNLLKTKITKEKKSPKLSTPVALFSKIKMVSPKQLSFRKP